MTSAGGPPHRSAPTTVAKVLILHYPRAGNTKSMADAVAVGPPDHKAGARCEALGARVAKLATRLSD